ncbi:MAG: hypothetical protein CVT88_00445 [Candidatus Altiarchaeales archaeon HGW-Altiarchaeales-1]|nr:MAG: hypothetical protein CVT88_00445 [Candidatus Altiarchaeales archaeon HGW-Altiarchaeales-1]
MKQKNKLWKFAVAGFFIVSVIYFSGCIYPSTPKSCNYTEICSNAALNTSSLPSKFDWRDCGGNWLTSVKDQGNCGSCWAFASVGAIESKYKIENNNSSLNLDLSEQYLVSDCFNGGNCNGGWPADALEYVRSNGVSDELCFPYKKSDCACNERCLDWANKTWNLSNYERVYITTNNIKKELVCNGPLITCGYVGSDLHCVVLVGWDDDENVWIIKNSWGTGIGYDGYSKIPHTHSLVTYDYLFDVGGMKKK